MPQRITITNYSNRAFAYPQLPTLQPGETRSRRLGSADLDLWAMSDQHVKLAGAGVAVSYDDAAPPAVTEVDSATTLAADAQLVVFTEAGYEVELPALSGVDKGKRLTFYLKSGTGNVTLKGNGQETIANAPNRMLTVPGQVLRLIADTDDNWALTN